MQERHPEMRLTKGVQIASLVDDLWTINGDNVSRCITGTGGIKTAGTKKGNYIRTLCVLFPVSFEGPSNMNGFGLNSFAAIVLLEVL